MISNIKAVVKFNDGFAIVLEEKPKLVYKRIGTNIIYGTDGIFYKCYGFDRPSKGWEAFGGSKFDLEMEDGEVINCYGQWWDSGSNKVGEHVGCKIGHAAVGVIDDLKRCYVYSGYDVDVEKYNEFLKTYTGTIFEYMDYEKIIKFDDMRSKSFRNELKLKKAKGSLIKEIKRLSAENRTLKEAQNL